MFYIKNAQKFEEELYKKIFNNAIKMMSKKCEICWYCFWAISFDISSSIPLTAVHGVDGTTINIKFSQIKNCCDNVNHFNLYRIKYRL